MCLGVAGGRVRRQGMVYREIRCLHTTFTIFAVLTSTHNLYYRVEIRKIMHTPANPTFLNKVGFNGGIHSIRVGKKVIGISLLFSMIHLIRDE